LGFKAPAYDDSTRESAALDVLAFLAFSANSDLYQKLVVQEQKADTLFGGLPDHVDPGLFQITARVRKADDVEYVQGQILETIKVPLANPDFAPFLQRARDLGPDTLFVFVPANGQAGIFARQFVERGLDKAGIKLIGTGDLTDDQDLAGMGDAMLGTVTAGFYSAVHPSDANRAFVEAFKRANPTFRPNFLSVSGYDGMHLIYSALNTSRGSTDGDVLISAMKGMAWESPRGPMSIDPETRDVVHNVYIRRVDKIDGELYNTEFTTFEAVKDPLKATKQAAN